MLTNCKECGKEISDKAEKCPHCGAPTIKQQKTQATAAIVSIIVMIFAAIIIFGVVCPRIERSYEEFSQDYEEREAREQRYVDSLIVQDGCTWTVDGNWSYIRGRVKNIGTRTVTYFKIKALYYDANKNVIDMDFTNSLDRMPPGTAKAFEIMHEHNSQMEYYRAYVEEVSVE